MIATWMAELRYACRSHLREKGASLVAVLTLALGIAVVTAAVAALDAVVWQPLVPEQARVVHVQGRETGQDVLPVPFSLPEAEDLWRASRSFEAVAAVDHAATGPVPVRIGERPTPVRLAPVSAGFFAVAADGGPLRGRWLEPADEAPGADVVAVISEGLWRRLGADPSIVGQRLDWAGTRSLRVIGVAPAAVDYPVGTEIWAPAARVFDGQGGRFDAGQRSFVQFELLGRLRQGVSIAQARAELSAIHADIPRTFPRARGPVHLDVRPLADVVLGDVRRLLLAIAGAAALVCLVAGVNVAALLLMRSTARRREVAIRMALGAGTARLVRQLSAEALVLAAAATVIGVAGGRALLVALPAIAPADIPRLDAVSLDGVAIAAAAGVALVWVFLLGVLPLAAHARATPRIDRAFAAAPRSRALLVFSTAEIAAALVVAVGAGLLVRSFAQLQAVDRGFRPAQAHLVSLLLPDGRQRDPRALLALYEQLLPALEAHPGVASAAPVHLKPGTGTIGLSAPMRFEGQAPAEAATNPFATWEPVMPGYFETLGVAVVRGRVIDARDRQGGQPVAVVTESVARRYWPGLDPIGRQLKFADAERFPWATVVGVVADTRYRELTRPWMTVYFAADQFFFFQASSLVVRSSLGAEDVRALVTARLAALDPGAAVDRVRPLPDVVAEEVARPRAALGVTGAFALLAVVLAAVGIYGVLSYDVRQRRQELAVRAAIGASPADLRRVVVGRGARMTAAGSAIGVAVAAVATEGLRSLLFEVQPGDPVAFASAVAAVVVVVLAATLLPATRAAKADPIVALRAE